MTDDRRTGCRICRDVVKAEYVERLLAEGHKDRDIAAMTRTPMFMELGPYKRGIMADTIRHHREVCVPARTNRPAPAPKAHPSVDTMARLMPTESMSDPNDVARLVRDRVVTMLRDDPDHKLSVKEGLAAQAMIDRREEKSADRQLKVSLARILTGMQPGMGPRRVGPDTIPYIEGVAEEVLA